MQRASAESKEQVFLFEYEKLMSFLLCHATECRDLMVSCTDSNVPNFSSNYAVLTCNCAASLCLCWRQNFGSLSHLFIVYLRVLSYSRGRETVSPNVQPKVWLFIYFLIYRSRYFPLVPWTLIALGASKTRWRHSRIRRTVSSCLWETSPISWEAAPLLCRNQHGFKTKSLIWRRSL